MALHTVFANDGESSFKENIHVVDGEDPTEVGARHVMGMWAIDVAERGGAEAYIASLEEFTVSPAEGDQAMLDLMDAVEAFLAGEDDASLANLRVVHARATIHRQQYDAV